MRAHTQTIRSTVQIEPAKKRGVFIPTGDDKNGDYTILVVWFRSGGFHTHRTLGKPRGGGFKTRGDLEVFWGVLEAYLPFEIAYVYAEVFGWLFCCGGRERERERECER